MSSYTKGKLHVYWSEFGSGPDVHPVCFLTLGDDDAEPGDRRVIACLEDADPYVADDVEGAERLAAAWNAFEGIDTIKGPVSELVEALREVRSIGDRLARGLAVGSEEIRAANARQSALLEKWGK